VVAGVIWHEEAGDPDRPLVALIHGAMDRSTGMLRLSRRLDERFRVLRYDRRGYGRSVAPAGADAGSFAMGDQVADLVALLAGRRALLVGHSYGGNVALATAMHHPDLVAGVAAYETPLSWEPWWPGTTAGAAARATEGTPGDAAERFMRRLIGDERWESLPDKTRQTRRAEGAAMVHELRDLQANPPWDDRRIHCPLVFGYGSDGQPHHADGMAHLHRVFPGSQLVVVDGARHDGPTSHSKSFAEAIVDPLAAAAGEPWASAAVSPSVP
jgi:pimeloyl-ACP methyl ester carboxylesterase